MLEVFIETIAINRDELKNIIRESFVEVLRERKDLISDAVLEALEDLGLARAMEEGRTGENEDLGRFQKKFNARLRGIK
jgi:hypothetical protein